jgi:hypothetical protein
MAMLMALLGIVMVLACGILFSEFSGEDDMPGDHDHVFPFSPDAKKMSVKKSIFVLDLLKYAVVVARRNTLCRLGFHKMKDRVDVLALGEVLHSPACAVFGCEHRGEPSLDLPNDGNNGTFLDLATRKAERGFDPNRKKNLGV